jgi:hypothetical protein
MGKQSRLKWERRNAPTPPVITPLETRWGKAPLPRAFGGMLQGLGLGVTMAVVCLAIGIVRIFFADAETDGLAEGLGWYFGGWLLGGGLAGALAPVRHRVGGRRGQGIVMAGIVTLAWMPLIESQTGPSDPGATVFAWVACTVVFGLVFAKLFAVLDGDGPTAPQARDMDPDFRTGRHRRFRR